MSNSAIVKPANSKIGVYLHWNGGVDSVTAFLEYCKLKGYRNLSVDASYGLARFTQVVANYFGGDSSIGLQYVADDNDGRYLDNGIYVVEGWDVVKRIGSTCGREGYDLKEFLKDIDEKQPQGEQLGDFLDAKKVNRADVKIGDIAFVQELDGSYKKYPVIGFGADGQWCNGSNVTGIPYVARFCNEGVYDKNPNNYLRDDVVYIAAE